MIQHDQPTVFGDKIIVAVSSVDDGPMNFKGNDPDEIQANRLAFLGQAGIEPVQTTLLQVTFEDETDFTRYRIIEDEHAGEGMLEAAANTKADALVATRPEQAIFLPLADCVGAVIYDQANQILMVSHLGRHSMLQNGGAKSIEYLVREFDSNPHDLLVWLSPAAGKENYPLRDLGGKGLHEAAVEQVVEAGVPLANIEVSHVDTTEDENYYSHSEFLAGNRPEDGRFAIVVMMTE